MATPTFYNALDDGSIGTQIQDNQENALLPEVTSQMRIDGTTILKKLYIKMDEDISTFISLENKGMFDARIMTSTGTSETASDVPSDRKRYTARPIISNTTSTVTISADDAQFFAVNDYISLGGYIVQITAIDDDDNGNKKITFGDNIPSINLTGTYVSNCIKQDFTAGNAVPFWIENVIEPGAVAIDSRDTIPLLIQS